jgi:hypothetical protein
VQLVAFAQRKPLRHRLNALAIESVMLGTAWVGAAACNPVS